MNLLFTHKKSKKYETIGSHAPTHAPTHAPKDIWHHPNSPTQRAIVVNYDNELNMPSSGMCETGLFLSRNALFPTVLKSQWPLWNMTGIQMPLCLWTGPMFGGGAGEKAGARGHSGCCPKSTTAICRRGGGASPKCLEVNCRPAGLWALISNYLMN